MSRCIKLGLVLGLSLAAGCPAHPRAPGEGASEAGEAVVVQKELLAKVQLSDTHEISFWEHEGGDYSIRERLHVDKDLVDGRRTLAEMKAGALKLSETYALFAGERAEAGAMARLRAIDALVEANAPAYAPEIAADEAIGGQLSTDASSIRELAKQTAGDPLISKAACAEPSFDWTFDVGWFKDNFCFHDSRFCPTQVTWASYGWHRGPSWFKATGFAQSHCSGARWLFQRKNYAGFPTFGVSLHTLADFDLPPRHLDTEHWTTTGDRAYFCKVTSHTGSNRTALAVHHD